MQKIYYHVTVWHVRGIVILKVLLVPNKKSASRHAKMTNEFTLPDVRVSKCSVPFKLQLHANGNIGRHQFVKFPRPRPHLRPRPQLRPQQQPLHLPLKNRLNHQNLSHGKEKFNLWDILVTCVWVLRELRVKLGVWGVVCSDFYGIVVGNDNESLTQNSRVLL